MTKYVHIIQKYSDRLFIIAAYLFVFVLPLHKMSTSIPLILSCLAFLLGKKQGLLNNKLLKLLWGIIVFYFLLHVLSYFFSEYTFYAKNDIVKKLPLFLFPAIFLFREKIDVMSFRRILQIFVFSSLLISVVLCMLFLYHYLSSHTFVFGEQLLSFTIMHPGYLSMYLSLALTIVWNEKHLFSVVNQSTINLLVSFIIFFTLVILASRMALICFTIIGSIQILRSKTKSKQWLFFLIGIPLGIVLVWNIPFLQQRFIKGFNMLTHDKSEVNSYTVDDRLMTWSNAIDLIKEAPILGHSIGDYHYHILKEKHNKNGFGKGYRQKLNAHNQFLESWLAIGILGFLSLIALYITMFYLYRQSKLYLLLYFTIICFSFSLIESIFQSQGGNMFFGFFLGLTLNHLKN